MTTWNESACAQIEKVLERVDELATHHPRESVTSEATTLILACIDRLAPRESVYRKQASAVLQQFPSKPEASARISGLVGILRAMRLDFRAGHLSHLEEEIRRSVFEDLLDLADFLLEVDSPAPAAVVAGSILEEHLRKLAAAANIPLETEAGARKKTETLNAELAAGGIFTRTQQKQVTAWYGLRNDAAHHISKQIHGADVRRMIDGIRDFIVRFPA